MDKTIANLRSPEDIMRFFDDFISYGCIDVNGMKHINDLGGHDFRPNYRTLSLEQSLDNRIGACIEQTNITRYLLERLGIRCRTFCTRAWNAEHPAPDDLYLVHCYPLAVYADRAVLIEHSHHVKRGIYTFPTETEAIEEMRRLFSDTSVIADATSSRQVEYTDYIPGGLSFLEFNRWMTEHSTVTG